MLIINYQFFAYFMAKNNILLLFDNYVYKFKVNFVIYIWQH